MAKPRKEWPEWWEWELELRPYTYKRLKERDCTEIELRRMMENATTFKAAKLEGRWIVETRFRRAPWKVVVEPAPEKRKLIVVTAYEVEKLK
jgi:hypothetical protein